METGSCKERKQATRVGQQRKVEDPAQDMQVKRKFPILMEDYRGSKWAPQERKRRKTKVIEQRQ